MKIFITGPPAGGKSMTGVRLAKAIDRWCGYYVYGNFEHAGDFFTLDENHIAVIDTVDLMILMTNRLRRFSIKIADDIGGAEGIDSRTSQSKSNINLTRVLKTNRTQNGVLLCCFQDDMDVDRRLRKIANIEINLNEYQESGSFRIAKLRKIQKNEDNRNTGIKFTRFMTYEHGEWVTVESIAVDLPDPESKKIYDEIRERKEIENTNALNAQYVQAKQQKNKSDTKPHCPHCGSIQLSYRTKGVKCEKCKQYI
jgi:hypothetical protein